MRGLFSLPVLDSVTGDVIGMIPPNPGMVTSLGSIRRCDGNCYTFVDENGVTAVHDGAWPWVEEEEAVRWGFVERGCTACAMAV